MALTQVSTGGVKDDAVTAGKIPANAIGSSEIADDAVDQGAIADEAVDEARLQISNAGTNGQFLQKQSGNTGGLTWADVTIPDADKCIEGNTSVEAVDTGSDGHVKITTEGTERVRVNQDGKLLIGTDTARTAIGATGIPALQVEGLNASDSQISIVRNSDTAAGPYFAMVKTRGTSDGSNTIIQADDTLGTLYFTAADGVDINQQSAFVRCQVDGTPGANATPGRLTFATTPDGGITPTERLRIGSAGQLGVAGANYGTSGQVLTSGGSGAAPSWADVGGWTVLNKGSISSGTTSATISDSLTGDYELYRVQFYLKYTSDGSEGGIQIKTGGNWESSNYFFEMFTGRANNEIAYNYSGQSRIFFGGGTTFRVVNGVMEFGDVADTSHYKIFRISVAANTGLTSFSSNHYVDTICGGHDSSTAITGVRLDGDSIAAGWYALEGLKI